MWWLTVMELGGLIMPAFLNHFVSYIEWVFWAEISWLFIYSLSTFRKSKKFFEVLVKLEGMGTIYLTMQSPQSPPPHFQWSSINQNVCTIRVLLNWCTNKLPLELGIGRVKGSVKLTRGLKARSFIFSILSPLSRNTEIQDLLLSHSLMSHATHQITKIFAFFIFS